MPKLSEPEILGRLRSLGDWERVGDMIVRSWQFPTPGRALRFVNDVAGVADRAGHHPDIVLSYRTVRVEVSTHTEGGVTPDDFALAAEVDAIPTGD